MTIFHTRDHASSRVHVIAWQCEQPSHRGQTGAAGLISKTEALSLLCSHILADFLAIVA